MDYRATLNLPQTGFKMKANLPQKEPGYLEHWEKEELYKKIQEHTEGKPLFVLHDGPPYANGNIHLGTAFNKILKDIILKSKRLSGFNAPYIPGWDCHGLPIEHNVDKEMGEKKKTIPLLSKRGACRKYAEKWIKKQKQQFQRLGVLGDWDDPYLTMNFAYEASIAREFNRFLLSDAVIRNKKPVYWCSTCTTALAEAEVEYHDHTSPSIYVKFKVADDLSDIDPVFKEYDNLAVAFHPDFTYAAVKVDGEIWILAKDLVETVMQAVEREEYEIVATFSALPLENRKCLHPFMERESLMVLADYVTTDAGTGCVHTAPGHGTDDYHTGLRYGLEILSPLDNEGNYIAGAGKYEGLNIREANGVINEDMRETGALIHESKISHSYPHCWRCKEPVIYRATPQWFIAMENNDLRTKALASISKVSWVPSWGMQRIYSMVENRPDWCLSRQRSWGVPITVISCKSCGEIVKKEEVVERIDQLFKKEGADSWFRYDAGEFLGSHDTCEHCGGKNFVKEDDILDVWFDSGVSHAAVCEQRDELRSPVDLYLEGSDQHRGWFQSSLLTSVGTRDRAPYKGVLTHGYVVDGEGRKMSKSVGNVVLPQEVIDKYGAEILRLWVSSEDYQDDIKVSEEILRQISDSYRKIRNTIRYMLGNLFDFDPEKHRVAVSELPELDRWALKRFHELNRKVIASYEKYEFHAIFQSVNYFCNMTMSSFYLDILKDRLYTSAPESAGRRAAQTVLYDILEGLLRLISPILSFTAAETWEYFKKLDKDASVTESVFFEEFSQTSGSVISDELDKKWSKIISIRSEITKALEIARRDKIIGHPLEAEVYVDSAGELASFINQEQHTLKEVTIVSALHAGSAPTTVKNKPFASEELEGLAIWVVPAAGDKCERCWTRSPSVGESEEHPLICGRCLHVLSEIGVAG